VASEGIVTSLIVTYVLHTPRLYLRVYSSLLFFPDIDECAEPGHGCSQLCNNTQGGYNCFCLKGYWLTKDNKTCIGTSPEFLLIFSNFWSTPQHTNIPLPQILPSPPRLSPPPLLNSQPAICELAQTQSLFSSTLILTKS